METRLKLACPGILTIAFLSPMLAVQAQTPRLTDLGLPRRS